jgi:hypothetical protein
VSADSPKSKNLKLVYLLQDLSNFQFLMLAIYLLPIYREKLTVSRLKIIVVEPTIKTGPWFDRAPAPSPLMLFMLLLLHVPLVFLRAVGTRYFRVLSPFLLFLKLFPILHQDEPLSHLASGHGKGFRPGFANLIACWAPGGGSVEVGFRTGLSRRNPVAIKVHSPRTGLHPDVRAPGFRKGSARTHLAHEVLS